MHVNISVPCILWVIIAARIFRSQRISSFMTPWRPRFWKVRNHIVDGRNPAPVEVGRLSHYLQGFIHARWLAGFLASTESCQQKSRKTTCRLATHKLENYCWWKKSCSTWYGKCLVLYRVLPVSTGAGCLPSTVSFSGSTINFGECGCCWTATIQKNHHSKYCIGWSSMEKIFW